jgi:two-component system sensor histidine kinase UhpB
MTSRGRVDKNILWVLGAGFALVIAALLASGHIGIQAMERSEARIEELVQQQRLANRLIDEIQGEEAGLSNLFYRFAASPSAADRAEFLERLSAIEQDVSHTLGSARASRGSQRWEGVRVAALGFVDELRRALQDGNSPSSELYRRHEKLVAALGDLVSSNFEDAVAAQGFEHAHSRAQLNKSLVLLYVALALSVLGAIIAVRLTGQVFRRLDWQATELSRLSAHVLETQETIVRRFSHELHDDLGQNLTAIEANLAALPAAEADGAERIEDCLLLVKDAISNVREMSQLLRPSMLDDFGLAPSMRWLAQSFSQRTGVSVDADVTFEGRLPEAVETHLFRIAQEALTNVARHSGATHVDLSLKVSDGRVRLSIRDNGHGFPEKTGRPGFGLIGMRERMAASGGSLAIESSGAGALITADVSIQRIDERTTHSNPAGR